MGGRGLAVLGDCARSIQPRSGGPVVQAPHDGGHRYGRANDGVVQEKACAGRAAPPRPWQSVRQWQLSGQAHGIRRDVLDESQGYCCGNQ